MEVKDNGSRQPWLRQSRAAALGFGLGATLALSPLVWAENPTGTNNPPPAGSAAGETMASPIALMQHQSFCAGSSINRTPMASGTSFRKCREANPIGLRSALGLLSIHPVMS